LVARHDATEEEILGDIKAIIGQAGNVPSHKQYREAGGKYGRCTFRNRFGGWGNAIKLIGGDCKANQHDRQYIRDVDIPIEIYTQFPRIHGDKVLVTADWHIPFHDIELVNKFIEFNQSFKADKLVIVGDFLDLTKLYKKDIQDSKIPWSEEFKIAKNLLADLLLYFDEIWWMLCNHEWRLVRLLQNREEAEGLYDLITDNKRIIKSSYSYCEINDWIRFNHPDRERKKKLSLPEELADVYQTSVIDFHDHRFAFAIHKGGKFVIGNGLHFTMPEAHRYKQEKMTPHDAWVQGWWCVEGKQVWPYVKHGHIKNQWQKEK
jgi:hypothetical protein